MNTASNHAATMPAADLSARLSSLALAAVMTLTMLAGINTLAVRDAQTPQMASTPAANSTSHA